MLDEAVALFDPLCIVFTGGEPLAAPTFAAAVGEVTARALAYRVITNGALVSRHLPLLLAHPPQRVRVSLSGGSETTHDRQRGAGSFRQAALAVAMLRANDLRAELSLVLTRESASEMAAAAMLAADLGAAELHFILPQPTPESAWADSDLAPDVWRRLPGEITVLARQSVVPLYVDYGYPLAWPRDRCDTMALRHLYIDARGRAIYCCQLARYGTGPEPVLGDLATESLATVVDHARATYDAFDAETGRRHGQGPRDPLDDFPCLSCARRHGRTGFLAAMPAHPWAALAQ